MGMLLKRMTSTYGMLQAGRKDWASNFWNLKDLKLKNGEAWNLQDESVMAIACPDKYDMLLMSMNSI
jgi:hypothetical protein